MPDDFLVRDGPVAVPMNYQVPQGGELIPLMVAATLDGTSATTPFYAAVQLVSPSGRVMGTAISESIAAGASASVTWFPGAEVLEAEPAQTLGITSETVFYDTKNAGTPLAMTTVLTSGVQYVVVIEGTYSLWNVTLGQGTPEANAQFPGSTSGRSTTQVGLDADTCFARETGSSRPLGHCELLQLSLDGGSTYAHVEPVGGPYGSPLAGHQYRYAVTGQGFPLHVKLNDINPPDNYGKFRISIQVPAGTGTGSGAGSLVPPADTTLNGDVLTVVTGLPAWAAPSGAGITALASPGGTITVTNPAGPTADVDLPSSGAVAGTYGDSAHVAQVQVNAEGIVTAAAAIAISGIAGAGFTTLFDQTLGADAAAIDTGASGVAQTSQHLLILWLARTDEAVVFSSCSVTVNNDGAANYDRETMRATQTTLSATTAPGIAGWALIASGANAAATVFGVGILFIPAYTQTTVRKTGYALSAVVDPTAANNRVEVAGVAWRNTAAISRVAFTHAGGTVLKAGSRVSIFGMG